MAKASPVAAALSVPACLLLLLPFVALFGQTPWLHFALDYGDLSAIAVSIGYGVVALALITLLGIPLAFWLAHTRHRLRVVAELLVLAALLTPALAMGILLSDTYGPYGPVGEPLSRLGISLNNNAGAFILAQLYSGLAYFILAARSAFENVPHTYEEAAQGLGATPWSTFWSITFPVASRGLGAGLALAWVRVVGEFGVVMIFAYFPQGIPVKLYNNLQTDGVDAVYSLLWLLLLATLPLPIWCLTKFPLIGRRNG